MVYRLSRILPSSISEHAQTLRSLFNQFLIICFELLLHHLRNLLHIMNNACFSSNRHDFVNCQNGSKPPIKIRLRKHFLKLIKQVIVKIFLILRKILVQFLSCINLRLPLLQIFNNPSQLISFKRMHSRLSLLNNKFVTNQVLINLLLLEIYLCYSR